MASILLVDDHPNFRKTVADLLAGEGFQVIEAGTGEEAVEVLGGLIESGNTPSVCLIDALLPKMSGFDFATRIKEADLESTIIFMSGVFKSRDHQQENMQKYDARAYLVKPFDTEELLNLCFEATGQQRQVDTSGEGESVVQATPLPVEGSLIDYPVLHLLWRAANEKHTGILDVFGQKTRSRFFVYRGRCTMAQSSSPQSNVGVELIRTGALTAEMYQKAVALCSDRSRGLYDVIRAEVWASEGELKDAYKSVIPRILAESIAENGRFRWTQTDDFAKLIPSAPVTLTDAIKFGLRETTDIESLEAHVMPRAPLRLGPGENWGRIGAMLEEACGSSSLSRAINGRATIAQLIAAARNDEDKLKRLKQAFLLMSTSGVVASEKVIKISRPEPEPPAAPAESKRKGPAPAQEGQTQAHVLVSDEERAADQGITFSPDEVAARKKIEKKFEDVQGKNHWGVLGVEDGAEPAQVKRAYLLLAKEFHVDTFADLNLGSSAKVLNGLFAQIQDAYSVLADDTKRAEYEAKHGMEKEGKSTDIGAIFQAENDFSKGKLLTERGEYRAAARLFEKSLEVNPANREWEAYHLYTSWFENRDNMLAAKVISTLEEIQGEFEAIGEFSYFSGHLAMEIGNFKKARTHLRRCLDISANHTAAQRALRIVQGKLQNEEKKTGGLMGRFKKG